MTETQETRKRPPMHSPAELRQVEEQDYGRAVEHVIRATGFSHDEAERLACAVLAPMMLAPAEPQPRPHNAHSEDPFVLNTCGWALVQANGTTIYCDAGDMQDDKGRQLPHDPLDGDHRADYAATAWYEDDARAIHLPTWTGEDE